MPETVRSERAEKAIECRGISKRFGTVLANDNVDFDVDYGEIVALLGENGSGKTTLVNMLSGAYHPDGGTIFVAGEEAAIHTPADAFRHGIGMIHQHFKLVEVMTAFENILLGTKKARGKKVAVLRAQVEELRGRYGLEVELDKKIYEMSVSEKQTVEVLKVLHRGAEILILDEPTAVLTPQEIERLFHILRRMREDGRAVVIITHKLNEVMEISDRVAVLHRGRCAGTVRTSQVDENRLTELMVGRPVSLEIRRPAPLEDGETVLQVENLTVSRQDGTMALKEAGFSLKAGEILGVAGVAGSGQKELCEAIVGLVPAGGGSVRYRGEELTGKSTTDIFKMGVSLAFVPEDRLGMGLVGSMGVVGNLLLKTYREGRRFFVDRGPAKAAADRLIAQLDIKTPDADTPVRMLSGGNVQKVLLGREIDSEPSVLITAYPVRGLDIGSSHTIYDLLNDQKKRGCAILFVGEDLDVLLGLCDRLLVLCHGEVTGLLDARTATKEQVGLLMMGRQDEKSALAKEGTV